MKNSLIENNRLEKSMDFVSICNLSNSIKISCEGVVLIKRGKMMRIV